MPRFFKKSHKYNVARNCFLAKVILLDNTTIEFNLLPEVTGADCLEKVSQVMDIQEVSEGQWASSVRYFNGGEEEGTKGGRACTGLLVECLRRCQS